MFSTLEADAPSGAVSADYWGRGLGRDWRLQYQILVFVEGQGMFARAGRG